MANLAVVVMVDARTLAFIVMFSALSFVIASLNRLLPSISGGVGIGHLTTDAILVTCIFLIAVTLAKRVGVASFMGLLTGLLMLTVGARYVAVFSWFLRGLMFDVLLFGIFRRPNPSMKHYVFASALSFFVQTVFGKSLSILLFGWANLWGFFTKSVFIPLALAGSIISILGAYLALKITSILIPLQV